MVGLGRRVVRPACRLRSGFRLGIAMEIIITCAERSTGACTTITCTAGSSAMYAVERHGNVPASKRDCQLLGSLPRRVMLLIDRSNSVKSTAASRPGGEPGGALLSIG